VKFTRRNLIKAAAGAALVGTATSQLGHRVSAHVDIDQEIVITMGEMFFQAEGQAAGDPITVPSGQVVRLVFRNEGSVLHDAHIGRNADLEGRRFSENLSAPFDMLEIPAGGEAWVTFTFDASQAGDWELGCFQLGHYEAGMRAPFIVQ